MYVSCQYKRGNTELFQIITTRLRDRQHPQHYPTHQNTTLFTKAHFNEIPDILIIIIIIIIMIIIIIIIIISQQKRNRNASELFYTEHDQRFSCTRKGRKIPLQAFLSNKITLFRKFGIFSQFFGDILLYRNYFMFPRHFSKNLSRFAEEFPVKQALDLGHQRAATPLRVNVFVDVIFSRERV